MNSGHIKIFSASCGAFAVSIATVRSLGMSLKFSLEKKLQKELALHFYNLN